MLGAHYLSTSLSLLCTVKKDDDDGLRVDDAPQYEYRPLREATAPLLDSERSNEKLEEERKLGVVTSELSRLHLHPSALPFLFFSISVGGATTSVADMTARNTFFFQHKLLRCVFDLSRLFLFLIISISFYDDSYHLLNNSGLQGFMCAHHIAPESFRPCRPEHPTDLLRASVSHGYIIVIICLPTQDSAILCLVVASCPAAGRLAMLRCSSLWFTVRVPGPEVSAALRVMGFGPGGGAHEAQRIRPSPRSEARGGVALPSLEAVRQRYRELAQRHHPDLSSGDSQRMQSINMAYELLQSSGALVAERGAEGTTATSTSPPASASFSEMRQQRRQQQRRTAVPDDFADGDDLSWSLKTSNEWRAMVSSVDSLAPGELRQPANHPLSHSKFFSLEEDATIYRMLRSGATVPQVGRTLGKPATFIEKRLHNTQFKLRVQYLLKSERRAAAEQAKKAGSERLHPFSHSTPGRGPNMVARALRRSPSAPATTPHRRAAWEPTIPSWSDQTHYADMSLHDKAQFQGFVPPDEGSGTGAGGGAEYSGGGASKMGRSYANYQRVYQGKRRLTALLCPNTGREQDVAVCFLLQHLGVSLLSLSLSLSDLLS
eukprot:gene11045-7678_t